MRIEFDDSPFPTSNLDFFVNSLDAIEIATVGLDDLRSRIVSGHLLCLNGT